MVAVGVAVPVAVADGTALGLGVGLAGSGAVRLAVGSGEAAGPQDENRKKIGKAAIGNVRSLIMALIFPVSDAIG